MSTNPYIMGKADSSWKESEKVRSDRRKESRTPPKSQPEPEPSLPKTGAPSPEDVVASLLRHPDLALGVGKILSKLASPWEEFTSAASGSKKIGFLRRNVHGEIVSRILPGVDREFYNQFPTLFPDQQGQHQSLEAALMTCDSTLQNRGWTLLGTVHEWPEDSP